MCMLYLLCESYQLISSWLKHALCVHTHSGINCLKLLSWALCLLWWVMLRINNHNTVLQRKWLGIVMSCLSCMPFSSAVFHLSQWVERHMKNSFPNVDCSHIWAQWNKSQMTTAILPWRHWWTPEVTSKHDSEMTRYTRVSYLCLDGRPVVGSEKVFLYIR